MTGQEFTDSACGRPALWFSSLTAQDDGAWADRALVSGNGCFVRDVSGREYLDARCALWSTALGYSNERIRAAITRQLHELTAAQIIRHDQPTKIALDYASRLVSVLPANLRHVRLCTTGAQAAEGAVLLSRFIRIGEGHPERSEVLALWDGYHGIAGLASTLTGERPLHEALAPLCPGVHHVPAGDIAALRSTVASIGAGRLSAVIMEPILGTDVQQLAPGYLHEVQDLCHAADIHFILDEVSTGFGRTGSLTVTGQLGLAPDMLLLSKALTSGYAALSAIAVTDDVLERTLRLPAGVFPHGSTADGLPLAVAAASAVLDEFADGSILANVASRGAQLTSAFADRIGRSAIRSVHGPGLMIAVGLADGAGEPLPGPAMQQVKRCLRDVGLLVSISNGFVLLTPPLILTAAEADLLIARFDRGLAAALKVEQLTDAAPAASGAGRTVR